MYMNRLLLFHFISFRLQLTGLELRTTEVSIAYDVATPLNTKALFSATIQNVADYHIQKLRSLLLASVEPKEFIAGPEN